MFSVVAHVRHEDTDKIGDRLGTAMSEIIARRERSANYGVNHKFNPAGSGPARTEVEMMFHAGVCLFHYCSIWSPHRPRVEVHAIQ
jgi:hypothetical protein